MRSGKRPAVAIFDLCEAAERADEVLKALEEDSLDRDTRLQVVQLKILLTAAKQTFASIQDKPLAPEDVYPIEESLEPLPDAVFLAGVIIDRPRCGEGLYKVTQEAFTSDLVFDDGAVLAPLNSAIPSRNAWSTLGCPFCGGRLLKDGRIHTLQYEWRSGQKAEQHIGEGMMTVRHQAGLTQSQFAAAIGESHEALNNYEHGQVVPLRVLSIIAQKFRVNWVWLETGVGNVNGEPQRRRDNKRGQRTTCLYLECWRVVHCGPWEGTMSATAGSTTCVVSAGWMGARETPRLAVVRRERLAAV